MWWICIITSLILITGVIIDVIDGEDDNDDYYWKEDNDIKIESMKFKVGDKVKINGGSKKGEIAIIIEVNQYPIDSIFMKYDMYKIDLDEGKYWWAENMIELIDNKPLFTLTAEEVEIARRALCLLSNDMASYGPSMDKYVKFYYEGANNLLKRIKEWKDENQ